MNTGSLQGKEGWAWLTLVGIAFWPTLASFHGVWTTYTYSHGYLAAAVAVWLAWRTLRNGLPEERDAVSTVAPLAVVGLSLMWLVAMVVHFRVVHEGVLPLLLVAWAATIGGFRGARSVAPAAWLALFALPFWEAFIAPLQALTVLVSGTAVRLMGIGAEISGDIIAIPSGSFEVAGSCSGLSYFIVGTFLGSTYAFLFLKDTKNRLKAVVLAALTSMMANWARVIGLILIGHVSEMEHSLVRDHHTYGWVVFGMFMGVWLWFMERRAGRRSRARDATEQTLPSAAPRRTGWTRRAHLATALVLLGPAIYWAVSAIPASPIDAYASDVLPDSGWIVENVEAETVAWAPEYPEADRHERWAVSRDSVTVLVDRVVYLEQEQGRELLSGENRIVDADWVAGDRTRWMPSLNRMVREMLIAAPDGPTLAWSWYEIGGRATVAPAWAEILALRGFFLRRPGAEVVVYRTRCSADSCNEAASRLEEMLAQVGRPGS